MRAAVLLSSVIACGGEPAPAPDAPVDDTGQPLADQLLARVAGCDTVVGGPYATDEGGTADISICGFPEAVVWTADLDVDCDGKMSVQCNLSTDPSYLDQTAATDSNGDPLDAATLPFVVIPGRGTRFDYLAAGLGMRSVVAVVFEGKLEFGVLGDVGPQAIIGEASYAMAARLGIDPDPATGGTDGGVVYIAFTGAAAKVSVIEDHAEAVALGTERAIGLLAAP